MGKKIGDKKIKKVDKGSETKQVKGTESVGEVKGVKKTSSVAAAGRVGSATDRKETQKMTLQEREKIFKMIEDEAEKMFDSSSLSPEQKKLVKEAVKIAVDSGLIEEES